MGGIWQEAIHVVLGVIMRKSFCRLHEVSHMAMELISLISTVLRFSGVALRSPVPVPARYSPLSSMVARHDR